MQQLGRQLSSRIHNRIVLPYLGLSLLVALLGAVVALLLVAGSLRDRLEARLTQSTLKLEQALLDFEDGQIRKLRELSNAGPNLQGELPATIDAFTQGKQSQLNAILSYYLGMYSNLQQLQAFNLDGTVVAEQMDAELATNLPSRLGASLYNEVKAIRYIVDNEQEIMNGKLPAYASSIVNRELIGGGTLSFVYTAVPVIKRDPQTGEQQLIGGVVATAPLDKLLQQVQSRSDVIYTLIHDQQGRVLASNTTQSDITIPADVLAELKHTAQTRVIRTIVINRVDVLFLYSPLTMNEPIEGYLAVASEGNSIFGTWTPSSNLVKGLIIAALIAVVGLGYAISRRVTLPIQELATVARELAQGKRDQRSRVYSSDEVGTLAQVLNEMTDRLLDLYRTSQEFGVVLEVPGVLHVTVSAIRRLIPRARIVVILPIEGRWVARFTTEPEEQEIKPFDPQILSRVPALIEASSVPEIANQEPMCSRDPRWVIPLQTQQRAIGLLVIGMVPANVETESLRDPLLAIASMTATAFQNALLYTEMEQEASKNRAILQSIADGVIVCDPQGKVMLSNSAALQMLGQSASQLHGQRIDQLPLQPVQPSAEVFAPGWQERQQLYQVNNRTLTLSTSQVISSDDRPLGSVMVLHDVTTQREVDRSKTDFIATISHELRTPLSSVQGYIDLLLRPSISGELNLDQQSFVDTIKNHVQSMSSLLNNVILVASIEAGALEPQPGPIDVEPIVEEALLPLRSQIEARRLQLVIDLPKDLPTIYADRQLVRIALANLIDNARRYTKEGAIQISAFANDDYVQIDVSDTGIGITPEDQARLFIRFNRGGEQGGRATKERGTGLGLAIARQLIEQQDGMITFSSKPGKGSVFSIRLPIALTQTTLLAPATTTSDGR